MKDAKGNEINLGDMVIYTNNNKLYRGKTILINHVASRVVFSLGKQNPYIAAYCLPLGGYELAVWKTMIGLCDLITDIDKHLGDYILGELSTRLVLCTDNNISSAAKEKPCKTCSKMNDFGKASCWWCGNNPG